MEIILNNIASFGLLIPAIALGVIIFVALSYRVVVPPNEVHIVQSARATKSYGRSKSTDQPGEGPKHSTVGNTYYRWPSWIPFIGVRVSKLPVSVFTLKLDGYAAYDKDRVPFVLDLAAFFRISDSNMAAERVQDIQELEEQLDLTVKGAARKILANSPIDEILGNRAIFGDQFTDEVKGNLTDWGVVPVKSIELMDIRDAQGSKVIENIMAKKQSFIEMESRVAVAANGKAAKTAEIDAEQTVAMRQQDALETVGVRTAQKDQTIGISKQKAEQAIKEEVKNTTTKEMAVREVEQVRSAEIAKSVQLVEAEQAKQAGIIKSDGERQMAVIRADGDKQQTVIRAEAEKAQTVTVAEGNLSKAQMNAKGIEAEGVAKASAEKALQLAPVEAQITLAKEIGSNEGYQSYLIQVKVVDANRDVGIAQAGALEKADIKVISNTGSPADGLGSVRELFTSRGGQALGAALEGLKNTEAGNALLRTVTGGKDNG